MDWRNPLSTTMKVVSHHIESLDVFRGMTIAAMILVNNPGDWSAVYPPLQHAYWTGCTAADLVFPCFLLIMGVAMPFASARQSAVIGFGICAFPRITAEAVRATCSVRQPQPLYLRGREMSMGAKPGRLGKFRERRPIALKRVPIPVGDMSRAIPASISPARDGLADMC